jgi:hypothetical protein
MMVAGDAQGCRLIRTTTAGLRCSLRVTDRGRALGGVLRVHAGQHPQFRVLSRQGGVGRRQLTQPRRGLRQLGPRMFVLRDQFDVGRLDRRSRRREVDQHSARRARCYPRRSARRSGGEHFRIMFHSKRWLDRGVGQGPGCLMEIGL